MTIEEISREAYKAYSQFVDWKFYDGSNAPMPIWDDLPGSIHDAWLAACKEIVRIVKAEGIA